MGFKSSTNLYALGGWTSSYPAVHVLSFHAVVSGDTLSFDYLYDATIARNGNTVTKQTMGISGIYGVI